MWFLTYLSPSITLSSPDPTWRRQETWRSVPPRCRSCRSCVVLCKQLLVAGLQPYDVGSILEMRLLPCANGSSAVPVLLWWIPVDSAAVYDRHTPGSPHSVLALPKGPLLFELFAVESTQCCCQQLLLPSPGGGTWLLPAELFPGNVKLQ